MDQTNQIDFLIPVATNYIPDTTGTKIYKLYSYTDIE